MTNCDYNLEHYSTSFQTILTKPVQKVCSAAKFREQKQNANRKTQLADLHSFVLPLLLSVICAHDTLLAELKLKYIRYKPLLQSEVQWVSMREFKEILPRKTALPSSMPRKALPSRIGATWRNTTVTGRRNAVQPLLTRPFLLPAWRLRPLRRIQTGPQGHWHLYGQNRWKKCNSYVVNAS